MASLPPDVASTTISLTSSNGIVPETRLKGLNGL